MPIQATIILDSGCFLPRFGYAPAIGYFQSSKSAYDIRVIADGRELQFVELKKLGKNHIIEIRHVKAAGSIYHKGTTSSPTFHDELLHMKDLYGEHMEVDPAKFDCLLSFLSGQFCGALVKPRNFKLHRKQADGKYAYSPDDAPKQVNRPIAHNIHVHFKLKNGEAIELARDGEVFWSSKRTDVKDRLEIEIIADNSTAEKFYRHALKSKRDSYWLPNQGDPPPVCSTPPCEPGSSLGEFTGIWLDEGKSVDKPKTSSSPVITSSDKGWPRTVERYTKVDFPKQCIIGLEVRLNIQLVIERPKQTRIHQSVNVPIPESSKSSTLTIQVTAPGFQLEQSRQLMQVPVDDNSETVTFKMMPLLTGTQIIEVEMYYEASRIGYFGIETNVLNKKSGLKKSSNVIIYEDPTKIDLSNPIATPQGVLIKKTLHVNWDKDSRLTYSLIHGNRVDGDWVVDSPGTNREIADTLSTIGSLISKISKRRYLDESEKQSVIENVMGIGGTLYSKFIPEELQAIVQQWTSETLLAISTNEPWIPWELFYDGQEFWGERFILFRLPRMKSILNARLEAQPRCPGRIGLSKIVHVIGGNIQTSYVERAKKYFGASPKESNVRFLEALPLAELIPEIKDADLIHFTCHGHIDPVSFLQIGKSADEELNLQVTSLSNQKFLLKNGCIVFANACNSNSVQPMFGDFVNFGWEFYRKGAAIFIGTLGTIPTDSAVSFAGSFYENFPAKTSLIYTAYREAKKSLKPSGNLLHLLYCLYGNPAMIL